VWIKTFKIENFKSFETTEVIQLDRHINVVVGQNHTGKTSLLNALALKITSKPHNSSRFRVGEPRPAISSMDISFSMSGLELRDYLSSFDSNMSFPIPDEWVREATAAGDHKVILSRIFSLEAIELSARRSAPPNGVNWIATRFPSNNLNNITADTAKFIQFTRVPNTVDFNVVQVQRGQSDDVSLVAAHKLPSSIYYFDAQRVPSERYPFGNNSTLNPNAANLPEVLALLQSRRTEYQNFVQAVRRVLPAIKWVSVEASRENGQHAEIKIWNLEEEQQRHDLTIPLSEGGTGVGQVLAILYVVLRSSGSIVIIDEPNSFLHPRAAKELISILREDRNNQFIISTHSPEIVVASDPERYLMLRFSEEKTSIEVATRSDLHSARQTLEELGSQLSDIFGADCVVWVEGPTEVQCFPLLLMASHKAPSPNVAVAPLRSTGDLEGRHVRAIAEIYRNVTSSHAIIPTAIALSLDGDKRNIGNLTELTRAFGSVQFLPRRCYENYLLHCKAIAEALNTFEHFQTHPTSEQAVSDWIHKHGSAPKYGAERHEVFAAEWMRDVDAPKLLDQLFKSLSNATEEYRKPMHSVQLTTWLIQNDESHLAELSDYVTKLVPNVPA
jgi:predicted ATPase